MVKPGRPAKNDGDLGRANSAPLDGKSSDQHLGGFGVLAAILICCVLTFGYGYLQGQNSERDAVTTHAYHQAAKEAAASACLGDSTSGIFDCVYDKIEKSNEQANTKQDLIAQFRAADSSLIAAIIALMTLVISAIGVWFVKRTLDATLIAVQDTSDATQAMKEANAIAREAMLSANRPWIFVETISTNSRDWRNGKDQFTWIFKLVNHGQSLAIIDSVKVSIALYDVTPPKPGFVAVGGREDVARFRTVHLDPSEELNKTAIIAPGGELSDFEKIGLRSLDRSLPIPPDLLAERERLRLLSYGPKIISWWLFGEVTYRDARNHDHVTGFCFRHLFPYDTVQEEGGSQYNYRT